MGPWLALYFAFRVLFGMKNLHKAAIMDYGCDLFQWDWLQVLHKVGAERAAAAVLTLDTPGANYRTVWALTKNFPHVKTFVRAHDVDHGINLEKAGATAVGCLNF
jgi:voltage-gated potassium channel Kch